MLDRRLNLVLSNLYCLSSETLNYMIKNRALTINNIPTYINDSVVESGFIIKFKDQEQLSIFNSRRLFLLFLVFNLNTSSNLSVTNIYKYNLIKKAYIYSLSKFIDAGYLKSKNNIFLTKYVSYRYTYLSDIATFYKKTLSTILSKKADLKTKFLRVNLLITIKYSIRDCTTNHKDVNAFSNRLESTINSIISISYIYLILKKRLGLTRFFIKKQNCLSLITSINYVGSLATYLTTKKLNIIFLLYINKLLKVINVTNILYYIPNINEYNSTLAIFDCKNLASYKAESGKQFSNTIDNRDFIVVEEKESLINYKSLFTQIYAEKNVKKILMSYVVNTVLYNYYNNGKIVSYKNLVLFYNLSTSRSYYNTNSM